MLCSVSALYAAFSQPLLGYDDLFSLVVKPVQSRAAPTHTEVAKLEAEINALKRTLHVCMNLRCCISDCPFEYFAILAKTFCIFMELTYYNNFYNHVHYDG